MFLIDGMAADRADPSYFQADGLQGFVHAPTRGNIKGTNAG